jgi:uncharacterized secreted protein with C-terminal beta-propeller domain
MTVFRLNSLYLTTLELHLYHSYRENIKHCVNVCIHENMMLIISYSHTQFLLVPSIIRSFSCLYTGKVVAQILTGFKLQALYVEMKLKI